jgi:hypothetical protein
VVLPYALTLTIYNSAGEVVQTLYQGAAQNTPVLQLEGGAVFAAGGPPLVFVFSGALQGISNSGPTFIDWSGTNSSGQAVSSGVYQVALRETDSFGHTINQMEAVTVLSDQFSASLTVYNSAGEAVRHLATSGVESGAVLKITSTVKALDPKSGLPSADAFVLDLIGPTGTEQVLWNGLNDSGRAVAPGSYLIQWIRYPSDSGPVVETIGVVLVKGSADHELGSLHVVPQPWNSGPLYVYFDALSPAESVRARLYTLSGELISETWAAGPEGRVPVKGGRTIASGVYLVEVSRLRDSQMEERQTVKFAVVR